MCENSWKKVFVVVAALLACAGIAQAGIRADLSGDAVVDFATTMDMPLMTVGNPGNAADTRYATPGYGAVDYEYNIGKFEVTTGQYTEFLNAVATTDTYGLYDTAMADPFGSWSCNIQRSGPAGSYSYSVEANWADRPVNFVSWGNAARFCNWLTNGMPTGAQGLTTTEDGSYFLNGATGNEELMTVRRKGPQDWGQYVIPTEDEWYKAAYHRNDPGAPGGNYFDYPTSSDTVPSNDLIDPDPGNNGNFYQLTTYTIDSPYWRSEVGEFENSESSYGTFDQGGNVYEWNEAIIGTYRGTRGGSFHFNSHYLYAAVRNWNSPTTSQNKTGFRVAEVPEPATMSLLAMGGLAVLRRRRK